MAEMKRWLRLVLLVVLYTLQGIPMGLAASIPLLLQERTTNYGSQALFTLTAWPFSLKLLWAPIVDGLFIQRFGRRKTWLVPSQLAIGFLMLITARPVDMMLDAEEPDITTITAIFFVLYFLCATQDIAVDGWALTMLDDNDVDKASICNSLGQSLGYFTSYLLFIALNDVTVCNKFFRSVPSDEPLVTLGDFFIFFGAVFVVTTIFVAVFKREEPQRGHRSEISIQNSYTKLLQLVQLKPVLLLSFCLLTARVGFVCLESIFSLKLQEFGVPKAELAALGPLAFPVQLLVPPLMGRFRSPRLQLWTWLFPLRLVLGVVLLGGVMYAQTAIVGRADGGTVSLTLAEWLALLVLTLVSSGMSQAMFTLQMQFYCKISDPAIGGTYMTFLNTLTNLGGIWPTTAIMWLVGRLTDCTHDMDAHECAQRKNRFYYIAVASLGIGLLWHLQVAPRFRSLETLTPSAWHVTHKRSD